MIGFHLIIICINSIIVCKIIVIEVIFIQNGAILGNTNGYICACISCHPVRARGLSRECVLRIPSVIVKGD